MGCGASHGAPESPPPRSHVLLFICKWALHTAVARSKQPLSWLLADFKSNLSSFQRAVSP